MWFYNTFFLIQICTRTKPDWLFLVVCNVLYIDILFSYNNWLWLGKDLMHIYDLWNTCSDNPSSAKSYGQRQFYSSSEWMLVECATVRYSAIHSITKQGWSYITWTIYYSEFTRPVVFAIFDCSSRLRVVSWPVKWRQFFVQCLLVFNKMRYIFDH